MKRMIQSVLGKLEVKDRLEKATIHNKMLLDNMHAATIVCDDHKRIQSINKQGELLLGISAETYLSQPIDSLYPICSVLQGFETIFETGKGLFKTFSLEKEAQKRQFTIEFAQIPLLNYTGAIAVISDVTEYKQLEDELHKAAYLSSLGTMAAGIAHEIKNPLVAVKSFSQLLPKKWEEYTFRQKYQDLVLPQLQRIDTLCDSLKKLETPKQRLFKDLSFRTLLEETLDFLKAEGHVVKNEVTVSCDPNTMIFVDKDEMSQVIVNLLLNAIDASTEDEPISLDVQTMNGEIQFSVIDQGVGLSEDAIKRLCDPFFSTKQSGTGLGMTVVHKILLEYNCDLKVISKEKAGTKMIITFPENYDRSLRALSRNEK